MPKPANICFDVALALLQGKREVQEDALDSKFDAETGVGYVVLADGMGGHQAGDVASKIVVTEVFNELKRQSKDFGKPEFDFRRVLTKAASHANSCLRSHGAANPETTGMGATLIAAILLQNRLFWISVGDSPLYIFRGSKLRQINEDHSLAPQIDFMAQSGVISKEAAQDHPDRNCLTSALIGEDIPQIDCPSEPFILQPDDVVIAASDGLQFLEDDRIGQVIEEQRKKSSIEVIRHLTEEVVKLDDPHQDNVSVSIIRVLGPAKKRKTVGARKKLPVRKGRALVGSAVVARLASRPLVAGARARIVAFLNSLSKNSLR